MEGFLVYALTSLLFISDQVTDPVQAAWFGATEARQLDCERMTQAQAHEQYPGDVPETAARTQTFMTIDALVCHRRVLRYGARAARDELLLTRLHSDVNAMVSQAIVHGKGKRWLVDAFYPDGVMVKKIADAARTTLAETGETVMGQAPLLAGGDLQVLHGMPLWEALPLACKRLTAEHALGPDDVMMFIAVVDPNETQLHVGVCSGGLFGWQQ